jgi:general secretion pathway protein G
MIIRKTTHLVNKSAAMTRSGFTLMEILIVVAIIVVLAGVGTFYLLPMLGESKEKVAKAQAQTITEALVKFNMDRGNYPSSLKELTQKGPNGEKAILEPKAIIDPWGKEFQFNAAGAHHDGNKPDVSTTSPEGKEIGNW